MHTIAMGTGTKLVLAIVATSKLRTGRITILPPAFLTTPSLRLCPSY